MSVFVVVLVLVLVEDVHAGQKKKKAAERRDAS